MAIVDTMQPLQVQFDEQAYQELGMTPWFSYRVNLPILPLPEVSERPHVETERLVVRPIRQSDLAAFWHLRQQQDTQWPSATRGRPDRDEAETLANIAFMEENPSCHWYFGAFLKSTGEMIGEGGLPDCKDMPRSGWPEAEILIGQGYRRQGYGTELCRAILDSWWVLPRELRRHQLLPVIADNKDPGSEIIEGVGFVWEEDNIAARNFFAKFLGQSPVAAEGTFASWDFRDGRERDIVRWAGTLTANPNALKDLEAASSSSSS